MWALDSGASRVYRPQSKTALARDSLVDRVQVGVGGALTVSCQKLESGEVVLPGQPLLSMGMTVQEGYWTLVLSPQGGIELARISPEQQHAIHKIVSQGSDHIPPLVEGYIPMMTDEQVMQVRVALDQRATREVPAVAQMSLDMSPLFYLFGCKYADFDRLASKVPPLFSDSKYLIEILRVSARKLLRFWLKCVHLDEQNRISRYLNWVRRRSDELSPVQPEVEQVTQGDPQGATDSKRTISFGHIIPCDPPAQVSGSGRTTDQGQGSPTSSEIDSDSDDDPLDSEGTDHNASRIHHVYNVDNHDILHVPSRPDCDVCQAAKRMSTRMRRGLASTPDGPRLVDGPLLVMDWVGGFTTGTDGSRYLAVIADVATGSLFLKPTKVKAEETAPDAFQEARLGWTFEGQYVSLHSDREGIMHSTSMTTYLLRHKAQRIHGVPGEPNSNCRAERFVRTALEGIRVTLHQSGLDGRFWPLAAEFVSTESTRQGGLGPRINLNTPVPFGTIGEVKLPRLTHGPGKQGIVTVQAMYCGIDRLSTQGSRVMYVGANGRLHRTIVREGDCTWRPGEYAFRKTTRNLKDAFSICRPLVSPQWTQGATQCDNPLCHRWRFVTREQAVNFRGRNVTCSDMGFTCEMPEGERVGRVLDGVLAPDDEWAPIPGDEEQIQNPIPPVVPQVPLVSSSSSDSSSSSGSSSSSSDGSVRGAPVNNGPVVLPQPGEGAPEFPLPPVMQFDGPPEIDELFEDQGHLSPGEQASPGHPDQASFAWLVSNSPEESLDHGRAISAEQAVQTLMATRDYTRLALSGDVRGAIYSQTGRQGVRDVTRALMALATIRLASSQMTRTCAYAAREVQDFAQPEARAYAVIVPNKQAFRDDSPEGDEWVDAVRKELKGLIPETLKVVPLSTVGKDDEPLPSLLILTRKHDGRFKARIVACGNFQKVQSSEVYSSVCGHDVWLQTLIVGLSLGKGCVQIDISQAFLQTDKRDDVQRQRTSLRVPKFVEAPPNSVWEVISSIYGLRSAPKAWQRTLATALRSWGFTVHPLDDSVWVDGQGNAILVYVDDLVVIADPTIATATIGKIRNRFKATDPVYLSKASREGPLVFLSHEMWPEQFQGGVRLVVSQRSYVDSLLDRFDVKSGIRTLNPDDFASDNFVGSEPLNKSGHTLYRSKLGGISFLAQCTRADVMAPCAILAQAQASPTQKHMKVVDKLLMYIFHTRERTLVLDITHIPPDSSGARGCLIEADFDASFLPWRARSGGIIYVSHVSSFWYTRVQRCIVLSTTEAEIVAASTCCREVIGAFRFLERVFTNTSKDSVRSRLAARGDNVAANLIGSAQASLRKVRHLTLSDLYCREVTSEGLITMSYVPTGINSSDSLTKVLPEVELTNLLERMCLVTRPDISRTDVALVIRDVSNSWHQGCTVPNLLAMVCSSLLQVAA